MSNTPPVFTSRRDPDAQPFTFVMDVEHEVEQPPDPADPAKGEPTRVVEPRQHTFTCRAQLTAGTMLDLQGAGQRLGYDRFMAQVLIPDDRDRWAELIRNPDVYIDEDALDDTIKYLVEQYAARPTKRSGKSQPGPTSTGSGSTDSPTATSEPSPPTAD